MVAHLIPTWYLLIASAHSTVTEGQAHNSKCCTSQWLLKCTVLTPVTGGVPVLNAKVITLHIQVHIWKDQLFLDQLPDDPWREGKVYEKQNKRLKNEARSEKKRRKGGEKERDTYGWEEDTERGGTRGQGGTRGRMEREGYLTNTTTTHTSNCGTRLTGSLQGYDMTTGEFTNWSEGWSQYLVTILKL